MISIDFKEPRNVYVVGEEFEIKVFLDDCNSTININVFQVGIENPSFKYSGPTKKMDYGYSSIIKTESFMPGYYEVRHIKTFSCVNDFEINNEINYAAGQDFSRFVFKVGPIGLLPKGRSDILKEVLEIEDLLEREFLSGVACSAKESPKRFCVLVFLCGVKITRRMRFGKYEIVPFRGADGTNFVDLVNEFLATQTKIDLRFDYTNELSETIRNDNPTCIVHFPLITTDKMELAMQYCQEESEMLSDVLSAFRGGLGRVVKTVVYDTVTSTGTMFTTRTPYRGNLLGGEMSGEDPNSINIILQKIKQQPLKRYFLSIYKDAVNETNIDFSYMRYWQLLETIAESKNYNPNESLRGFEGQIITYRDGKDVKLNNAKAIVYALIRSHGMGEHSLASRSSESPPKENTEFDLWSCVKCWHSMRNAASHFGGFRANDDFLKRAFDGYKICEELYLSQGNSKHGFLFENLKSTAWLVLRRELVSD